MIYRGRNKLRNKSSHGRNWSSSNSKSCKYCGKMHSKGNCPAYGKKCQKCGRDNHFKSVCRSSGNDKHDLCRSRPKKGHKGKRFHEINEEKNDSMDDLADQVQSLFYHDVHFNSINMRMYTEIECKTSPTGKMTKQTFKVDTGADGNLMPITMFTKLFPKISLDALGKTIESGVTLYAYNNTPIKQFGTCSVMLKFKGKSGVCKFYVVEHNTVILGITDSERLGLVRVNFDTVDCSVKVVHDITQTNLRSKLSQSTLNCLKG